MLADLQELYEYDGNLADLLTQDELNKIGSDVIDGFDVDMKSRETWDGEMKDAMSLALQVKEEKTFPWRNASNVKMPLLTEAAIQFWSRMMPALIPGKDLVKSRVIGEDRDGQKKNQGIRVSKHMSYQMLEEMEDWESEMSIGMMILPILGNMYKKTYLGKKTNISEMLSPSEFVINNNAKNMETAYRKSHILYKTKNDIRKEVLRGNYLDIKLGEPKQKEADDGSTPPEIDNTTPFKVIEQHTYLDLDEDELEEPYIVTVDYHSKQTLSIEPCFDLDGIESNEDEEVIDVEQIQYFTKYGFIPNPDGGIMDLGLGKLLGPTNESVNTLINQLIDAGTKANMGGGFLGRGVRIKGGSQRFTMGEYKRIDSSGQDLARNIVHLPVNDPSPTLFNLLGLLINAGQRLASTLDSQIGENPGQNQKATTTMAVQEQGQKIFNGIYKSNLSSLNKEVKKLFKLNSYHLPAESYLNVLDLTIDPELGEEIKKSDYDLESLNIVAAADPSYSSRQEKMAKAASLQQKMGTGLINNQVAMKEILEAEEQPNIEALLQLPEQQPSIEMLELQHSKQIDWANVEIKALELQQEEVKISAEAIYKLAQAEGVEEGTQLDQYRAQVEELVAKSKDVGQRASAIKPTEPSGVSGLEGQ